MRINLRTTVEDSRGNDLVAWIEMKGGKPVLHLKEKTGETAGEWSWYVSSLMGDDYGPPVKDKLALDYGQGWFVTGMRRLMDEVAKVFDRQGIVVASAAKSLVAEMVRAGFKTEVGDVTEEEPVGSTSVKTRTKERMQASVHSSGAQVVIQALRPVREVIADLR